MKYRVGDKVIHWTYGLGEIIQLEEKTISGQKALYYVVRIRDLTLWVQTDESGERSLRQPTPSSEFAQIFKILRSPGVELSPDRQERRLFLLNQMRDGTLESICRVLRDLTLFCTTKKINDNDKTLLERTRNLLITEWKLSLSVPADQAERELTAMLTANIHPPA